MLWRIRFLGIDLAYRQVHNLVWHHHQDVGRLQLLPMELHDAVPHTGGGYVNPQRFYIPGGFLPDEPGGVDVFCIYGNGTLPNGHCNDLDHPETGVVALGRNWLYPPQALVFAKSSAGGHLVYLLNYEFAEFPLHTVLVANSAGNIGFLAASFSDFCTYCKRRILVKVLSGLSFSIRWRSMSLILCGSRCWLLWTLG